MADNASPGPVARVLQALLSALMHIYTSIFGPSSSTSSHDQEQQKQPPQQQQQQQPEGAQQTPQSQNQASTQPASASRLTDEEATTGTLVTNTLARGQTIRRVFSDHALDVAEPDCPAQVAEEEQHQTGNSSEEGKNEMAGRGRGRGNSGPQFNNNYYGGGRGHSHRNNSTHSQTQMPVTANTPGVTGTPSSRPSSSSANRPASAKRPGSGSSDTKTQLPLRQGSTNGADGGVASGEKAQTAPSAVDYDALPEKATPVVRLPPTNVSVEQKTQSQSDWGVSSAAATSQAQKENERPGYTNAAAHVPAASIPVPNVVEDSSAATTEQKPATAQVVVPVPKESQNGTTEAAKPPANDTPATLPTPIVVPLPYTMKPIPPKLLGADMPGQILPGLIEPKTPEERAEREYHLKYMRAALDMGQLALDTNETPVGCVLVWRDQIIAKGMNATNITRNGTRHAEFMALSALLSRKEKGDIENVKNAADFDDSIWGDVDPSDGHVFPYGQKLHPAPVVDRSIVNECILYVTVEPCVMCASLLRQLGIKKVYFGAVNDKFGGTGGVFRIHMNSKPVPKPTDRPYQNGYGPAPIEKVPKSRSEWTPREDDDGDGGNVEPGFPAEGGFLRDEAVSLLRRFYVQENGRAPQPRKKEGRAARLFAMEAEAHALKSSASEMSDPATAPQTPIESEPKLLPQAATATKEEVAA